MKSPAEESCDDAYVCAFVFNASKGYATPTPIDPAIAPAVNVNREFSTKSNLDDRILGGDKLIVCPFLKLLDTND